MTPTRSGSVCSSLTILLLVSACAKTNYTAVKVDSGERGMVVTAHPLASEAGRQILKAGGSAADAAIASQFALAVVCPRAGNLGGGGFWVNAPANDAVRTLDYRERAPAAATRNMYLQPDGSVDPTKSLAGPLAAGIPGTVDGMWLAYTYASRLKDWSRLLQPAIRLARKGYRVSAEEAERLNRYRAEFVAQNDFAFPFVKNDAWRPGDLLVQPTLASTLDSIAKSGPSYFYSGGFAERLAAEISARGGVWTADDLNAYATTFREPVEFEYGPYTIYSMPPPSSGGVALAQMFGLLDPFDLKATFATDTAAYYHLLIESMRRAYEDRAEYLGDPDFVRVPIDSLTTTAYLREKWSTFRSDSATDSGLALAAQKREVYETTHTSIIDGEGNAVSITTTLNGNFGCKTFSRTGGFFLNNEMDDFSAKPGVPNQFGLIGGEANAIAPGKRMLSSMTPTIVKRDGETVLVLGSPGGSTIITAVLQVILNDLVLGMTLEDAVNQPRLHHQWLPDEVVIEANTLSPRVQAELERRGHVFRTAQSIGRVKAVQKQGDTLTGVGDIRSADDSASGY